MIYLSSYLIMFSNLQYGPVPKIFIVDNDIIVHFTIKIKIKQTGILCTEHYFDDPHEALNVFLNPAKSEIGLPDLLILDISMPKMTGWEFLEQLRTLINEKSIPPVYLLSSFETSDHIEKAKRHPLVKGYFVKPISKENLTTIISDSSCANSM